MNLDSEEQLAGVAAHELAHVTQRHVASRLERAQFLTLGSLLLAVAGIAVGGQGGGALAVGAMGAGQSAMLNYSRMDENEADHIGLQYLVAAGYPPTGMVGGFKILRQKSWMSGTNVARLPFHPPRPSANRINGLRPASRQPKAVLDRKQDNRQFLRVKTLLWGRYGDPQARLQRFAGKDALSRMGAGMVLARQNRVNEASAAFDQALAAAPNDPLVLREAGAFHYRKGDMGPGRRPAAQGSAPGSARLYGRLFLRPHAGRNGRAREAAPYYRDVLRAVPDDPEVHEAFSRSLGKTAIRPMLIFTWPTAPSMPTTAKWPNATWRRPAHGPARAAMPEPCSAWKMSTKNARSYGNQIDGHARNYHSGRSDQRANGSGRGWPGDPGPKYDHEARRAEGAPPGQRPDPGGLCRGHGRRFYPV